MVLFHILRYIERVRISVRNSNFTVGNMATVVGFLGHIHVFLCIIDCFLASQIFRWGIRVLTSSAGYSEVTGIVRRFRSLFTTCPILLLISLVWDIFFLSLELDGPSLGENFQTLWLRACVWESFFP